MQAWPIGMVISVSNVAKRNSAAGTGICAAASTAVIEKVCNRRISQPASAGFLAIHDMNDGPAEIGQIIRLAAGDEMAVNHHGSVFPYRTSIDQIVLDPRRPGNADALVDPR